MYTTVLDLGTIPGHPVQRRRDDDRHASHRTGVARTDVDAAIRVAVAPMARRQSASASDGWTVIVRLDMVALSTVFATTLKGMPDDSLGVVVVASLDGANAVTDRIADRRIARHARVAARGRRPPAIHDDRGARAE